MAHKVTKYGVFISSPGDVEKERVAVRDIIARWNLEHSATKNVVLEALMWETHVQPTMELKAQEAINRDLLRKADLLVAILWSRMGTPTEKFESGTEEEIRLFHGQKHVYFSNQPAVFPSGHNVQAFARQLESVQKFKEESQQDGLVRTFSSLMNLEQQVSLALTQWVDKQPSQPEAVKIVLFEREAEQGALLNDWNRSNRPGIVLLFNVELNTFRNVFWFNRTWGRVQDQKSITQVVLLLPKYKIERLKKLIVEYKEKFLHHPANAIFSVGELKTPVDGVQTKMSTGTGFAMFRFGNDPLVGELHPRSHIYIFSKPFSNPTEDDTWDYKYALEINDHDISSSLEEVWNEYFDPDKLHKVADLINDVMPSTTEENERIIEPLIKRARLASDNAFETKLRIREKLFHPNVPSYVLNQNYYLLDWNPAFEITFPTDRFYRGQSVREFLNCLDNYDEILVKGQAFLNNPPLYHVEPFIYVSPLYGRMAFTKITSPVTDEKTGEVVGWNLVLNVDSVEKSELYAEHRKYATELDALITKYASAYDEITRQFQGYQDLVELHCQAVKDARNVLDVGAGPGGVTQRLLKDGKCVTAVDNNDEMLLLLRQRCRIPAYENTLTINKVNVEVLNGLQPVFDGAVLLHVLFTLARPQNCLRKIYELLLPGSVLALSGPRKTAVLENLFEAIEEDARRYIDWSAGEFAAWRSHLKVFREVNLKFREMGMISRYDINETTKMLTEAGFKVDEIKEGVYAKQGVFFVARKPLQ